MIEQYHLSVNYDMTKVICCHKVVMECCSQTTLPVVKGDICSARVMFSVYNSPMIKVPRHF